MIYILIILFILALVIILIIIGKPEDIGYKVDRFLDSFEKTDYNKEGRIKHDYLFWNFPDYTIKINYWIIYKWKNFPFNRKNKVSIKLDNIKLPDGFEISFLRNSDDFQEHNIDYEMELVECNEFFIKIAQIENNIDLAEPQLIKFDISIVGVKFDSRKTISYKFLIGEDLGTSWVAFDPGTTATTIAYEIDNTEITIAKNTNGETLTPSILVFNRKETNSSLYGYEAENRIKSTMQYLGFRSIKKLLGFKDTNRETGKNGKELAEKLVSVIYNDIKQNNFKIKNSKRAIVAIPNNYTAAKIKDMMSCIENLGQFKEIRTIYEAEAIVFYYLSNKSALEQQFDCKNTNANEIILVFDMGGATINATVAQISKQNDDIYEVNILSKIGYGIGGDSIDYCILKSIFDFEKELDLQQINIFDKKIRENLSQESYNRIKEDLITLSLKIKLLLTKNQNKTEFISANDLQIYLSIVAGKDIYVDADSDFYRIFKKSSRFCILRNKYFTDLIYKNVNESTSEALKISGISKIDKIILAGRSTSFPNIEANISGAFSYSPNMINLNIMGVAKTAVAEGACWYGVNNNSIKLNNLKTSANFGFVKTKTPDKQNIEFINLVGAGQNFIEADQGGIKLIQKTKIFNDLFSFDGGKVNFYQIMSSDCETIIAKNQKHKFSKIETIKINQESEKIGMRVCENDDVICSVRLVNGKTEKTKGVMADQEITDANEEHYTWILNN
jgi:molecular chaperone DnaK (HSP70)